MTPRGVTSTAEAGQGEGPPRPPTRRLALALVACLGLLAFTSNKLYVGAQLRGELDGIPTRAMVLGAPARELGEGTVEHWLSPPGQLDAAEHTIQLVPSQRRRMAIGDTLAVRCDGRECYLPDSVYISDGNRSFDIALLGLEALGTVVVIGLWLMRWRAWRRFRTGSHLPAARAVRRP